VDSVSVVINTLNEEKNLPGALASVKDFADEIIVADAKSSDKTAQIAREYKAKVYSVDRYGYVEPARNFAISKASGDWILILDSDERLSESLKKHLQEIIKNPQADYFRIPRKNIIFSKWMKHTGWWPDYNIRFFKKGKVSWNEIIHSVPLTQGKGADLQAKQDLAIIHHNYHTIEEYLTRMNNYTSIQASQLIKSGYKYQWKDLVNKPTEEFLSRYFASRGYLDGVHGLALSLLQAFSQLSLYLKIWQSEKFNQQKIDEKEFKELEEKSHRKIKWWLANVKIESSGTVKSTVLRIFRKFS